MFTKTAIKKTALLTVALLVCVSVIFAACTPSSKFVPVDTPDPGAVSSNGGIAVKYGDYLYYVNGNISDVSVENTYAAVDARVGSVVRLKMSDVEALFKINDDKDLTTSQKSEQIADYVRQHAQTVVPRVYYSANTTTTRINGIFIFNDRIYITTPNDQLTAGGNPLTSQSVLKSYKLNGEDEQTHYVFTSNAAQIWLQQVEGKVVATYVMDSTLHTLDVASGKDTLVSKEDETVSSVNFDWAGNCIFFLDADGSVCKLAFGATEYDVVVENVKPEGHDHSHVTYTIKNVNNGTVYYTIADENNSSVSNICLYSATSADNKDVVVFNTNSITPSYGWQDKVVYIKSTNGFYGVYCASGDGSNEKILLSPQYNDSSITLDRLEGDTLYYTSDSISYSLDLTAAQSDKEGVPYAASLAAATGWAQPDFVDQYVITIGTGTVSAVKFDADKLTNSSTVALTLTVQPDEEE